MKSLISFLIVVLCTTLNTQAQQTFTLDYALNKWTTKLSTGSNGSINYAEAPYSITVIGSDGSRLTNADIDFTISITAPGVFSFDWEYFTNDATGSPRYDIAGVLINGIFTQLNTNAGSIYQTGHYTSSYLAAGTVIGFRVRSTDNLYGNAIFRIAGFSSPMFLLPVEYRYFSGKPAGSSVQLNWGTAMETNNSYFEVERSVDGLKFSVIGKVAGKGNTQSGWDYTSYDYKPHTGINYYRLKQVDANGTATYSKTVKINFSTENKIHLFPNPASDHLTVQFSSEMRKKPEALKLFDATGKLLQIRTLSPQTPGNSLTLNISGLIPGVYFLHLQNDGSVFRFIKE